MPVGYAGLSGFLPHDKADLHCDRYRTMCLSCGSSPSLPHAQQDCVQATMGSSLNLGSIPLELETAMPVRHASSWAVNDSMRVLGMLFPPCGDGATPEEPGDSWEGTAETADAANSASGGPLQAAAATCMPTMQWFSAALEVPDYVEFCAKEARQRHVLHGVALLLMAPAMALMRFTIPTIAADFYDAGIFVVAAALAPFTAGPLFGVALPAWLPPTLMVAMTCVALAFLAFGVRSQRFAAVSERGCQ